MTMGNAPTKSCHSLLFKMHLTQLKTDVSSMQRRSKLQNKYNLDYIGSDTQGFTRCFEHGGNWFKYCSSKSNPLLINPLLKCKKIERGRILQRLKFAL